MRSSLLVSLGLAVLSTPALAQRAGENAATQSSDAFGRSVGSEKTGLYNNEDVRGFNPVDAGNVRLEGLYFDQVERISSRIVDGNTIRVGAAALRYPFPAPTGLVDYNLTQPGKDASYSFNMEYSSPNSIGPGGSFEFKQPLGDHFGISGGVGFRNATRYEGGHSRYRPLGLTAAWRPQPGTEVLLFGGLFSYRSDELRPYYYPVGTTPPPKAERGVDLSQPWASRNQDLWTSGAIIKTPLLGAKLEAGLFYSAKDQHSVYADLMRGVGSDGSVANRRIIAERDNYDGSWSGEVRLVKEWTGASINHRLIASVRGRSRNREFGGGSVLALGPSTILRPDLRTEPVWMQGAKNRDEVRQITGGVAWSMVAPQRFSLDVGVSKSRYRKALDFADAALADPVTRDNPLLLNVAGSVFLAHGLSVYAGYTRGQEEALVAPDIATNRSEAPPALRTSQVEAGARWAVTPHLTFIAGAFSIKKPYYNLDPALRYRQLGELTNRGIEVSLTGQIAPGLTLVSGSLFLDPTISGEAVDSRLIGPRPVGQIRRRSVATIDWRMGAGKGPLSLDATVESLSSRMGNAANTLVAPPRATLNLGARYRFKAAGGTWLLRPVLLNVFNEYGWNVTSSGGFTYSNPRTVTLQLIADF
ncbi:MAG: TonB-dependent receptor [Sphingomonadaceae bacterium]|nr:TonB-dependent receptor [Sphingomonadaceae bacterium]